jgi:hypothetical protein
LGVPARSEPLYRAGLPRQERKKIRMVAVNDPDPQASLGHQGHLVQARRILLQRSANDSQDIKPLHAVNAGYEARPFRYGKGLLAGFKKVVA